MELRAWGELQYFGLWLFLNLFSEESFLKQNQKQKFHGSVGESAASVVEVGLRLQNHLYDDFLFSFIPPPTLLHSSGYL